MNAIYIFTGLGADQSVFKSIDFGNNEIHFVDWILPEESESIENYARRLSRQIKSPSPILIGLSFGGIVSIEVAKILTVQKIIIISSAKSKNEIPFYIRLLSFLPLHKIIPVSAFKKSNFLINWFFGVIRKEDRAILKDVLKNTNLIFLKWAIDKIINWKNVEVRKNVIHIHGSSDRILPNNFLRTNFIIKNGGHLMVLTKANEINEILRELLEDQK